MSVPPEPKSQPPKRRRPLAKIEARAKRLPALPVADDAKQRQVDWEQASLRLAKETFQPEGNSVIEEAGGRRLLHQILVPLAERIAQAQQAIEDKRGKDGRRPNWHYAILLLKPHVLAAITASAALRTITPDADVAKGARSRSFAREIAAAVRTTVQHQEWLKKQKEDDKPDEIVRRIGTRPVTMTPRSWERWSHKFSRIASQPWPESDDLTFGRICSRSC